MTRLPKPPSKLNEYAYRIVKVGQKEKPGQIKAKSRAEALGKLLKRCRCAEDFEVVEGDSHLVAMIHCQRLSAHKHWEDDLWGAIIIWDIPEIEFTARR